MIEKAEKYYVTAAKNEKNYLLHLARFQIMGDKEPVKAIDTLEKYCAHNEKDGRVKIGLKLLSTKRDDPDLQSIALKIMGPNSFAL